MTAARPHRSRPVQPELPLNQSPTAVGPPRNEEWRLDERTRAIGLRGVALARARLRPAGDGPGRAGRRGDPGTTGRAA